MGGLESFSEMESKLQRQGIFGVKESQQRPIGKGSKGSRKEYQDKNEFQKDFLLQFYISDNELSINSSKEFSNSLLILVSKKVDKDQSEKGAKNHAKSIKIHKWSPKKFLKLIYILQKVCKMKTRFWSSKLNS